MSLALNTIKSAAAAILAAAALAPASAIAAQGDYTHIICADPETRAGVPIRATDGLSTDATFAPWATPTVSAGCDSSPMTTARAITITPKSASSAPAGSYAALRYSVADPALRLVYAEYFRAFEAGASPGSQQTQVLQRGGLSPNDQTLKPNPWDFNTTTPMTMHGRPEAPFHPDNEVDAVHNGRSFHIAARCAATGSGSCDHTAGAWRYLFFGGAARLHDAAPPTVLGVSGELATDTVVHGSELIVDAADVGAGLYRARLFVDGTEEKPRQFSMPTTEVNTCFDVNPGNGDPFEFMAQNPCPARIRETHVYYTGRYRDGSHHLQVLLEDAGGNATTLLDRVATIDNHPLPELVPWSPPLAVTGTPQAGGTVVATTGEWLRATDFRYTWERCPTDGGDDDCREIVGASAAAYAPAADDVGKRLRFRVTAINDIGEETYRWSARSAPVAPENATPGAGNTVGGAAGAPSAPGLSGEAGRDGAPGTGGAHGADAGGPSGPNGRNATAGARITLTGPRGRARLTARYTAQITLAGRLTDASGHPITAASLQVAARERHLGAGLRSLPAVRTDDAGRFTVVAGPGPSRTIEVAYRADLGDSSPAATATVTVTVTAAVSLKVSRARVGKPTLLTGRLRHAPKAGVHVQVQALDGRRWRTFDTVKTRRGGTYRFAYRFKPTARGRTFALRVLVDSPAYPFSRGASRPVRVRVNG